MRYITRKQYVRAMDTLKQKIKALPGNEDDLIHVYDDVMCGALSDPYIIYAIACGSGVDRSNAHMKAFGMALAKAATLCENFCYRGCYIQRKHNPELDWEWMNRKGE